jgi:hypothetical protein
VRYFFGRNLTLDWTRDKDGGCSLHPVMEVAMSRLLLLVLFVAGCSASAAAPVAESPKAKPIEAAALASPAGSATSSITIGPPLSAPPAAWQVVFSGGPTFNLNNRTIYNQKEQLLRPTSYDVFAYSWHGSGGPQGAANIMVMYGSNRMTVNIFGVNGSCVPLGSFPIAQVTGVPYPGMGTVDIIPIP